MASIVPITDWQGSSSTQSAGLPEATPDMKQMGAIAQRQIDKRYNEWKQKQVSAARAHNADMASVGYDKDKYAALIASGAGLSQMSDHEREYITSHYQATNPFSRKEYTDSVADQYLASVGLPASKELNNYRKAYYDYVSAGGVKENFSELYNDTDAVAWMRDKWASETKTGANGQRVDSKGKDVTYADTLVDEELRKNDLMPSSQVESYYQRYKEYRATQDKIDAFYNEVYNATAGGNGTKSTQQVFMETLAKDEYRELAQYIPTMTELPDRSASKYAVKDELGLNVVGFNEDAYNNDYLKAITSSAKKDTSYDWDISFNGYEQFAADKAAEERRAFQQSQQRKVGEAAEKWLTTAATTDAEKRQRTEDMAEFSRLSGIQLDNSEMQQYFMLLDAGVPSPVIESGSDAILEYINTEFKDSASKWATAKMALDGYVDNGYDATFDTKKSIYERIYRVTNGQFYALTSGYDVAVYNREMNDDSTVSPSGALYALVNGKSIDKVNVPAGTDKNYKLTAAGAMDYMTEADRYSVYRLYADGLVEYMTEDERGTFNHLFRNETGAAIKFLDNLSDILRDRRDAPATAGILGNTFKTDEEKAEAAYRLIEHQTDVNMNAITAGTSYDWQKNAWNQYKGYSDEQLEQILAEDYNTSSEVIRNGAFYKGADKIPEGNGNLRDIMFVLETREQMQDSAALVGYLREYTPEKGAAATEAADHLAMRNDAPYARAGMTNGEAVASLLNSGWKSGVENDITTQMSQAERDAYNWLYETKGIEAAEMYYASIRDGLVQKAADSVHSENAQFAKDNPVLASILSNVLYPVSGIMSLGGTVLNFITGTQTTQAQAESWDMTGVWRETVSEEMTPFWSFVYGTGMSMFDSGAAAGLDMAVGGLGELTLASSAYASTLRTALDRGLDSDAATFTALAAGAAEYITEKVGLETLMEGIKGLGKGAAGNITRDFLINIGKQMVYEGSEEVSADVLNLAADALINGDMSEMQQNIDRMIETGYTREEATRIAWRDQGTNTLLSFAGGALSGGIMSAGGGAVKLGSSAIRLARQMNQSARMGANVAGAIGSYSPAQTGASVRTRESEGSTTMYDHIVAFTSGKQAADRLFGEDTNIVRQNMQSNSGDSDYVARISSIANKLSALNNTDYLYGYLYDADGNALVSEDDITAIASVFASMGADVNAENVDAVWTHFMAAKQNSEQRNNNTHYGKIKTAQGVREIVGNINGALSEIENAQRDHAAKVTDAQTKLNDAEARLRGVEAKLNALDINDATYAKDFMALQASKSALLTEINNHRVTLDTINGRDARQLEQNIAGKRQEIERNQAILDQHYASASAFLNEYAPNALGGANVALRNMNGRVKQIEAQIDAVIAADMDDDSKRQALRDLHDRLADAKGDATRLNARLSNEDQGALATAMQVVKSGSVSEFVRQQGSTIAPASMAPTVAQNTQQQVTEAQNAPNAAESTQEAQTENPTPTAENTEESASDAVKQDNAEESAPVEKRTAQIGGTTQRIISRVAHAFGCEVVWGNSDTVINEKTGETLGNNNGAYNPDQPKNIYLNTTMVGDKVMSDMQIAAREVFTHEVLHYVANTTTYFNIENAAMSYYDALYKDAGGIRTVLGAMMEAEGYDETHAREEATARFVESVLFADEHGTKRALTWLARSDRGMVGNFLTAVEYLIKSGNVRSRTGSDATVLDQMLLDAELNLAVALKERDYLDKAGLSGITQQQREAMLQDARQEQADKADAQTEQSGVMKSNGNTIEEYVRLDDDTELARLIENRGSATVGTVIADYIMSVFGGEQISMSDGREAIIDRHDAKKLSQYPKPRKASEIANLRQIVEKAKYDHSVNNVSHKKFTEFHYYVGNVSYNNELFGVEISVGVARNDKQSHLYDIRDWHKKRTAGSINSSSPMPGQMTGVSNTSDSSANSISNPGDSVNHQNMATPEESVSDIRGIFQNKSKGTTGTMKSNGRGIDEYVPLGSRDNRTIGEHSINTVDTSSNGTYNNGEVNGYGNANENGTSNLSDTRADQGSAGIAVSAGRDSDIQRHGLVGRGDRRSNLVILKANRGILVEKNAGNFELNETTDHKRFADALAEMRANNPEGGSVDPKTVEELDGMATFLSDDNAAGVAIEPSGNITAVFKNKQINPSRRAGIDLIFTAIAAGGDRLDCYGIALVNTYAYGGMEPVARVAYSREYGSAEMNAYIDAQRARGRKGFESDPDIYFMRLKPGATIESVLNDFKNGNTHVYTQAELDALPLMEYDEAEAYRNQLIEQERNVADDSDEEYMRLAEKYRNGTATEGETARLKEMVDGRIAAQHAEVFAATDVPTYSIRRSAPPKNTITVYKTFTLTADGQPSALFVSSQYALPVGVWLDAQDTYHFTDQSNGHLYVPSTKNPNTKGGATGRMTKLSNISTTDLAELEKRGYIKRDKNGKYSAKNITSLAYRPGWHAGDLPFFPQGGMKVDGSNYENIHRYNQVVFECEMDMDKDYTSYSINADGKVAYKDMQEMPVGGGYKFATNPMAQSTDIGAWYISGSLKINRALTEAEANAILAREGRNPQEWQAYQDEVELKALKDKLDKDAYEKRIGSLDLNRLGYDPTRTAEGMKLPDLVTYDDDGNIIPLSQRYNPRVNDVRYSNGMSIDDYVRLYGQKSQNAYGEANNIRTPELVDNLDQPNGRRYRVSDTVQTLKEVPHIQQSVRDMIDNGVIGQADGILERHGLVYEPITLNRMHEIGAQYITDHGGLTQAMYDLTRDMPRAAARDLVQYMSAANQVFTEIGAEGTFDPNDYYEFVASYIEMRSAWGRVGRAMQLVNDSPLGRVAYWNRVVDRINERNRTAVNSGINRLFYRGNYTDIVVPQEYFDTLSQAQTPDEINAAENAITEYIGQHSPLTVSDALRNWRYFSMLANPVTHARNMLGNTTMLGGRVVKDTIAAGMENVAVRIGLMNEGERRHAVVLRESAAVRDYVRQLWNDNGDAVQAGGRNGFDDRLSEAVRKSPFRIVDRAMRFNGNALESEDRLFLYSTFTAAASQYIAAQNIDVNNITREQEGAIVQYATQQAQEATYRDASRLADALNQFARSGWGAQLAVDAVMPFKKTPINIAKRGIEYSPAGLFKGLFDIARNASSVRHGGEPHVSASAVVDELAKGVTGTLLAAIGFFLAKCGILKVSAGEGDRDSAFERDIGRQDYSLEIGDLSIKIESLAPLTFPLFMGAQLQRMTREDWNGLQVSDLTNAAMTLADPLMDMSFMSSLNDVLATYNENKIGGVLENAASAYIGQYIPTIGSKLNQTINATRRTAKASQASPLGTTWDYRLRSWASKLPGVNQAVLEPYVTTTGEYDTKDSFGEYLLAFSNNFLSPVNVQVVDTTPVNTEIARLVETTGQSDFVPQNPKKYLTIGGERYDMTAKEYTQYSKEHNETVYALLSYVIQSDAYARATEEQRVSMLEKAYDKAHTSMMDKYKAIFAQK